MCRNVFRCTLVKTCDVIKLKLFKILKKVQIHANLFYHPVTRDAEQNNQVVEEEKSRVCSRALIPETDTRIKNTPKPKCLSSHKSTRSKVKPHAIKDTDKENRHPFALYGGGEKQTDMASRKTHNVGPEASTAEVSVISVQYCMSCFMHM